MKIKAVFFSCVFIGGITATYAMQAQAESKFDINQLLPKENQGVIGLKELFDLAQNNYSLIAQNDAVLASKADKVAAYLDFGPSISASYSYEYQSHPSIKGDYSGGNRASVTANLNLYDGLKTFNKIREKGALHRASIADKNFTEQNLYLQIIQQYYAYFTNYSNLISLKQKKTLLQSNVKRLKELYASGLTTVDDLESLKAEASLTDYQIAQKELEMEENRLNLSLLTNSQVSKIKRDVLKYPDVNVQKEKSDITAFREQTQSLEFQRKYRFSYAPSVNFYDTFGYKENFGSAFSQEDKLQNTVGISVSFTLDSGSIFKQKEAMGLKHLKSLKELAYKQEEQKKEIVFYKKSLDIAKAKVRSAEAGLKSAMITFENVSKRYDAQLVNYVDYLNALSQKFTAEATYVESLNNYEMQKANFAFYSGQDLKAYVK